MCEYISFERSGSNVIVCALICNTEDVSANIKELKGEPVTTTASSLENSFLLLEQKYPDMYYKALKAVLISENLNETDKCQLLHLFLNKPYLPINVNAQIPKNISCAVYLNTFPEDAEISYLKLWDYMQNFSNDSKNVAKGESY